MKKKPMKKWAVDCMKRDERGNEVRVTCIVYAPFGGRAYGKVVDAGYLSIDGEYMLEELPL